LLFGGAGAELLKDALNGGLGDVPLIGGLLGPAGKALGSIPLPGGTTLGKVTTGTTDKIASATGKAATAGSDAGKALMNNVSGAGQAAGAGLSTAAKGTTKAVADATKAVSNAVSKIPLPAPDHVVDYGGGMKIKVPAAVPVNLVNEAIKKGVDFSTLKQPITETSLHAAVIAKNTANTAASKVKNKADWAATQASSAANKAASAAAKLPIPTVSTPPVPSGPTPEQIRDAALKALASLPFGVGQALINAANGQPPKMEQLLGLPPGTLQTVQGAGQNVADVATGKKKIVDWAY
jgi:hypothetical protein